LGAWGGGNDPELINAMKYKARRLVSCTAHWSIALFAFTEKRYERPRFGTSIHLCLTVWKQTKLVLFCVTGIATCELCRIKILA
jgi:hypothetical protein